MNLRVSHSAYYLRNAMIIKPFILLDFNKTVNSKDVPSSQNPWPSHIAITDRPHVSRWSTSKGTQTAAEGPPFEYWVQVVIPEV